MSACVNVDALARSETFGRLARAELEQIAATMYRRTYR